MITLPLKNYLGDSVNLPRYEEKNKDKDYYRRWGTAAMQIWSQGKGATSSIFMSEVDVLRAYASGTQDNEQYKNEICPIDKVTKKRISFANISWDNVSIMPKVVEAAVNHLMSTDYEVFSVAMDEGAVGEKLLKKYELFAKSKLKKLYELAGEEVADIPDNLQQLDLMVKTGSIKLPLEIGADMLSLKTMKDSDWDDEIKIQLYRDLFVISLGCVRDIVDTQEQEVYAQYVDVKYLLLPYSKSPTYSDVPFIGHIEFLTEQKLRKEMLAAGVKNEDINNVISSARSTSGESGSSYDSYSQINVAESTFDKDTGIPVLRLEFRDEQMEQMVERTNNKGDLIVHKEDYDPYAKDTDKRKYHHRKTHVIREMSMVLGQDFVYAEGIKKDMAYIKGLPCFSYHPYKVSPKSKVSQCVSIVNDMQLAQLRIRMSQANAMPDGHLFDLDAMMNVSMGGKQWEFKEIVAMMKQTGSGVYRSSGHRSQYTGTSAAPYIKTAGGTGRYYEEQLQTIDRCLSMISEITGVNEFMSASTQQANTPVANQRQMMASSANVLKSSAFAYKSIKERLYLTSIKRWQVIAMNKKLRVHEGSIGSGVVDFMELSAEFPFCELGVYSIMKPTQEEKNELKSAAYASVQAARQGAVGISWADYFFISRTLESDNIKLAQLVMDDRERKAQEAHDQMMQQNQQASMMGGAELEKQRQQTVALQEEAKRQTLLMGVDAKKAADMELDNNEFNNDLRKMDKEFAQEKSLQSTAPKKK
jgi:hypothetical protein